MEQQTVMIKNFLRITKIVQVSAMKVHFQIAERSLFYLNPDIQHRRMTYPPERGNLHYNIPSIVSGDTCISVIAQRPAPISLMLAPMRYTLSSMMRKRSWFL